MPLNTFTTYIGTDKKLHALYGALGVVAGFIHFLNTGSWIEMFAILVILEFAKELYDWKIRKTRFCWEDIFYTIFLGYGIGAVTIGKTYLYGYLRGMI